MKPTHSAISLVELTKEYPTSFFKRKTAVQKLSLEIPEGEVVGLLGANGSGKSTTLKMILGFLRPTSGTIFIFGKPADSREARALIGYLPENPRFQKFLTATQILKYFGHLYGLKGVALSQRIHQALELVGLKHAALDRVSSFSKGMTQRLAIAQAILNQARLLIFDEPMSGLDPYGRIEIRKLIQTLHEEMPDTTVFFSSHILSDVETLCSSVALLKQGSLHTYCKVDELLHQSVQSFDVLVTSPKAEVLEKIKSHYLSRPVSLGLSCSIEGPDNLNQFLSEMQKLGVLVSSIQTQRKGLEHTLFANPSMPVAS